MEREELVKRFSSHSVDEEGAKKMYEVRNRSFELAEWLNDNLLDGRDKATALTKLEEFVFFANAGISRGNK